jgi:hypothetical protein
MRAIKNPLREESQARIRPHHVRCGPALFLISADDLFRLRQLAHGSQAAGADIDRAHNAVDFNAAALDIQHEAAARALLRERHIVAMHGLAFAYFTTTRHMDHPLFFIAGLAQL